MSGAQEYYDGLIGQGHAPDAALGYTQQHFPDFQAAGAAPVAAAPMAAAPAMAAAPVAADPMTAAPEMGGGMGAAAPLMGGMPATATTAPPAAGGGGSPLGWVAVACIALTLILSVAGQFGGSWLTMEKTIAEDLVDASPTSSLDSLSVTPVKIAALNPSTMTLIEVDWTADMCTEANDPANGTTCDGTTLTTSYSDSHASCTSALAAASAAGATEAMLANSTADCNQVGEMASAGSTGGMILWVGTIAALIATVLIAFNKLGMSVLPVDTQKFGMFAGIFAGVIVGLAVLVWSQMLPDGGDASAGMSVWLTVVGAITGIASGVLIKMFGSSSD